MPVLEFNGQQVAQSVAILAYAGRLSGLYPIDPFQGATVRCDTVIKAKMTADFMIINSIQIFA